MKDLDTILLDLGLDNNIFLDDIPNIDLYMDQVTQLFESKFNSTKRYTDDKVLTKTMINNYAKGKLFFPIKNKKYSKEHIILIALIYQLKGALSINDIKTLLDKLNHQIENDTVDLENFYSRYLKQSIKNVSSFKENIDDLKTSVQDETLEPEDEDTSYLEQVLLVSSLVHVSNMYRKLAEKLVDEMKKDRKD